MWPICFEIDDFVLKIILKSLCHPSCLPSAVRSGKSHGEAEQKMSEWPIDFKLLG
jgi:hypothetical protein